MVFFGGPDDRECLALARRMAEHPGVNVTAMRFVMENNGGEDGRQAVKLKPAPSKNEERSYTFSTADVNIEREKVGRSANFFLSRKLFRFFFIFCDKNASNRL